MNNKADTGSAPDVDDARLICVSGVDFPGECKSALKEIGQQKSEATTTSLALRSTVAFRLFVVCAVQ